MRRILRILPVYLALLLFVFFCERAAIIPSRTTFGAWLAQLTYTQNWYIMWCGWEATPFWLRPTWSLGVEEQFYLVWPLLVRKLSAAALKQLCIFVLFVSPIIRVFVSLYTTEEDATSLITFCHFDGICLGSLLAISIMSGEGARFHRWLKTASLPALALFFVLHTWAPKPLIDAFGFSLLAIFFGAQLLACLPSGSIATHFRGGLRNFYSLSALRFAGTISYCAYLVHLIVFSVTRSPSVQRALSHIPGHNSEGWTQLIANWLIVFLVATFSWYLYEAPLLRLKKHFRPDAGLV